MFYVSTEMKSNFIATCNECGISFSSMQIMKVTVHKFSVASRYVKWNLWGQQCSSFVSFRPGDADTRIYNAGRAWRGLQSITNFVQGSALCLLSYWVKWNLFLKNLSR